MIYTYKLYLGLSKAEDCVEPSEVVRSKIVTENNKVHSYVIMCAMICGVSIVYTLSLAMYICKSYKCGKKFHSKLYILWHKPNTV